MHDHGQFSSPGPNSEAPADTKAEANFFQLCVASSITRHRSMDCRQIYIKSFLVIEDRIGQFLWPEIGRRHPPRDGIRHHRLFDIPIGLK